MLTRDFLIFMLHAQSQFQLGGVANMEEASFSFFDLVAPPGILIYDVWYNIV